MFFDKDLVENSEMRRVWRAGFGRMEEQERNASFMNICSNLEEYVRSEDPNPRRRLSLRTSSVLVEGTSRIYRDELSRLTEDVAALDSVMTNPRNRKSTGSERDTSTNSSNLSASCDSPEQMRNQILRYSKDSIQTENNEFIGTSKTPDLIYSLSSIRASSNSPQSSNNDGQNGQSAKRRKLTDPKNINSEYPSSPSLTTDRDSKELASDEEPDIAHDNQNAHKRTKEANAEFYPDDQPEKENSSESSINLTSINIWDFFASLQTNDSDIETTDIHKKRTKSRTDKKSDETIQETDGRNKSDTYVTLRNMVTTVQSEVYTKLDEITKEADRKNKSNEYVTKRKKVEEHTKAVSDTNQDVEEVIESDNGGTHISPILCSTTGKGLRDPRLVIKNIEKPVTKKNQASQTDAVSLHPSVNEEERIENENLPFGYLLIHDSYRARYPTKLVISSLHPSVMELTSNTSLEANL